MVQGIQNRGPAVMIPSRGTVYREYRTEVYVSHDYLSMMDMVYGHGILIITPNSINSLTPLSPPHLERRHAHHAREHGDPQRLIPVFHELTKTLEGETLL